MLTSFKASLLSLAALVAISATGPASAEEWTRTTASGSYTSSSTGGAGVGTRCSRSYSGVTASGKTFSGQQLSAHGPFNTRSVGSFSGPGGRHWVGFRRFRH